MKYIKFALLNIVVFGSLVMFLSLLLPSSVAYSTDKVFNTKASLLKPSIVEFNNWSMFAGTNKVTVMDGDSLIVMEHQSEKMGQLQSRFTLSNDSFTHVNWALRKPLPWYKPWEKFAAMLQDKSWRIVMDSSLNHLSKTIKAN